MGNDGTVCVDTPSCYIKKIRSDECTPITVLYATGAVGVLESVSAEFGRSRYSIVLIREFARVMKRDGAIHMRVRASDNHPESSYKPFNGDKTFLQVLQSFADQHEKHNIPDRLGIPFPAGGIGYLSFEYAKYCDAFTFEAQTNELNQPEALFIIPRVFAVFDHVEEMIYIVALSYGGGILKTEQAGDTSRETLRALADDVEQRMHARVEFEYAAGQSAMLLREGDKQRYCGAVSAVRKRIIQGYLLQAVPSRRVQVQSSLTPVQAYRLLRHHNPSPYLFYLNFGDHSLIGSSPESHIKSVHGTVIVTPIAGTRRRGTGVAEDMRLADDLINDPKERAEHLMLVDLARNDISRVCAPETVEVKKSFEIKYFARVMHIVSEVHGRLREGKTGIDALEATFPAGTVSGAPKIQAVYELSKLEPDVRGFYAGVVGYVAPGGEVDTCITLRSMLHKDDHFYLQSGAGVVYDSNPEREFEETQEKISALIRALGADV